MVNSVTSSVVVFFRFDCRITCLTIRPGTSSHSQTFTSSGPASVESVHV